jgi:hypothetical protein
MMRYRVATVLTAFAIALWATQDIKSFLMALCIAAAIIAIGLGVAQVIGAASAECPTTTYTEADLEGIESHEEYLAALDRVIR